MTSDGDSGARAHSLRAHRIEVEALSFVSDSLSTDPERLTDQERRDVGAVFTRWGELGVERLNGRNARSLAVELVDALLSLEQAGVVPTGCAYALAFAYRVSIDDVAPAL